MVCHTEAMCKVSSKSEKVESDDLLSISGIAQMKKKKLTIQKDGFLKAVKLVLESTFFVYRGQFYQQTFGVPMGSPLCSDHV